MTKEERGGVQELLWKKLRTSMVRGLFGARRTGGGVVSEIPTTMLGRTGLEVTRLGYGSMELRHTDTAARPGLDRDAAGRLLNDVVDSGITYIDTSPTYGPAEELIGEFLGHRRSEFTLATKAGFVVEELPGRRQLFTPENVRRGLEWSLGRLRTDCVDLVQLPGSPSPSELEALGTFEALEALRSEGKCRFLGISGWVPSLSEHIGREEIDVFQIPYSALETENEALIANAAAAGIGTVIRGGVAQGLLALDGARAEELGSPEQLAERRERWQRARADLRSDDNDLGLLLRYTLSHDGANTVIVGTSDPGHLAANIAAAERGPLPSDVVQQIRKVLVA